MGMDSRAAYLQKRSMESSKNIDELLQRLVGQYAWSTRRGFGTFLTLQFGEPHRDIREPIQASENDNATVKRALGRRRVSIKGDISLWIRDSRWSISNMDMAVDWTSDAALVERMLVFHLDSQKVLSAERRVDETVLEFDLGTTLRMGKSMFPGDIESALWSISLWEGLRASLFDGGEAIYWEPDR
jgi:hypothetical protein